MPTPVDYIPAIMHAIDLISRGYTKTRACDECNITTSLFDRYVRDNDTLRDIAAEATQRGYDTLADILLEIDSNPIYGSTDAKMAGVISKNIQWYLSRRKPKEYGDRVTVDVQLNADKTIIEALSRAKVRALTGGVLLDGVSYSRIDGLTEEEQAELEKLY
jgi:hypothetical protein